MSSLEYESAHDLALPVRRRGRSTAALMNPNPDVGLPLVNSCGARALVAVGLGMTDRFSTFVNSMRRLKLARSLIRKVRPTARFSCGCRA